MSRNGPNGSSLSRVARRAAMRTRPQAAKDTNATKVPASSACQLTHVSAAPTLAASLASFLN